MLSANVKPNEPKRLTKNEQLRIVNEEANQIWMRHKAGAISSEEASKLLTELRTRYVSLFDRILDL
jgi:hypothetical protein